METYQDAVQLTSETRPTQPVFCIRPHAARKAAHWFRVNFPGNCLYAVKANPAPWIIEIFRDAGVSFDVASLDEARLVRSIAPDAMLGFMHPIKASHAIAEAYFDLGVRTFSLDSLAELDKIMLATGNARDLTLCVRIAVSSEMSRISLASKFGASAEEAVELLQRCRQAAERLGVCFHVGSQAMAPAAFVSALDRVEQAVVRAGVIVDIVDVGGGFPAPYPGMIPPPLAHFVDAIKARFETMLVAENCELWCEPGRALCAEAASLVVCVEGRKGDRLYINDGIYGALFDAGTLNWPYPIRLLRSTHDTMLPIAYHLFGPTCDDHDHIEGPFQLPADMRVGDYVEFGMLGAYGSAMATRFNGFGCYQENVVTDAPLLSAYGLNEFPAIELEEKNG